MGCACAWCRCGRLARRRARAGQRRPGQAAADLAGVHQGGREGRAEPARGEALAPDRLGHDPEGRRAQDGRAGRQGVAAAGRGGLGTRCGVGRGARRGVQRCLGCQRAAPGGSSPAHAFRAGTERPTRMRDRAGLISGTSHAAPGTLPAHKPRAKAPELHTVEAARALPRNSTHLCLCGGWPGSVSAVLVMLLGQPGREQRKTMSRHNLSMPCGA